ncbi:MAG: transcription antitermination factor NusB [Neisseriaceae bacterium]|nr:transcription antitermination factor NusB [Neisseriaceae bacterium]
MKTPRRRAREFAVQGMYQALLNPDYSSDEIIANIRESDAFIKALEGNKKPRVDEELFESLIRGVNANKLKYAPILRPLLDRNENDVSPIEYAILFVACHELIAMPQTPYPVIINEAIEIGKAFGGTEGYKFINGILDKLASQVRPDDPNYHAFDKNNIKIT